MCIEYTTFKLYVASPLSNENIRNPLSNVTVLCAVSYKHNEALRPEITIYLIPTREGFKFPNTNEYWLVTDSCRLKPSNNVNIFDPRAPPIDEADWSRASHCQWHFEIKVIPSGLIFLAQYLQPGGGHGCFIKWGNYLEAAISLHNTSTTFEILPLVCSNPLRGLGNIEPPRVLLTM